MIKATTLALHLGPVGPILETRTIHSWQTRVNIICTHIYLQSIAIFGIF